MHRWSLIALITIMIVTGLHAYRAGVIRYAGRLMTRRNMNRLLCEVTEVNIDEITQKMTVLLKKEDPRAKHIKEVVYGLFLKVCIFGTRLTCRCLNFRCCTCNQATPSEVRSLTWEWRIILQLGKWQMTYRLSWALKLTSIKVRCPKSISYWPCRDRKSWRSYCQSLVAWECGDYTLLVQTRWNRHISVSVTLGHCNTFRFYSFVVKVTTLLSCRIAFAARRKGNSTAYAGGSRTSRSWLHAAWSTYCEESTPVCGPRVE